MTKYLDMDMDRINAAQDAYFGRISDADFAKRISDRQWAMVSRKEADMDAAFVLAVEAETVAA